MTGSEISILELFANWTLPQLAAVVLLVPTATAAVLLWIDLRGRRRASPPPERSLDVGPPEVTVEPAPGALAESAGPAPAEHPAIPVAPPIPEPVAAEPAPADTPPAEPLAAEPVAVEPAPPPPPEPPAPRFRLRDRLARTSETLVGRLGGLLSGRKVDSDLLEELEALLFTADLGVQTAESLLDQVRKQTSGSDASEVRGVLREAIHQKLRSVEPKTSILDVQASPHVILVLGVNGSGKTTTIGKLAARFVGAGKTVLLGAGDTFRAAAIEQLQVWGERVGCEVVAGSPGGDPASVAFDTVKAAKARNIDVAIIDTAGRLQTKKPLMEELEKISRVIAREIPDAPHESLLVLDSNTGQNALSQGRLFAEVANISGLVLTKLDGSAKGGVIVGLADELQIPVKLVGVGEGIEDLRDFDADEFVEAIFAEEG